MAKSTKALAVKAESKVEKTMTVKELAEVLGVSDRWVRNTVEKLRNNNSAVFQTTQCNSQGGYLFNEQQVTAIKLELQNHSKVNALSPKTTLEKQLLIQQAMQIQAEMIAELQAANERTASERDNLAITLDSAKQWASIKRMEALNPSKQFSWRALKRYAQENGYALKEVFDQNYGTVKAYPRTVWEAVYGEQIDEAPWLEDN